MPRQFFVPGLPDLRRDSESVLSGYLSSRPARRTCSVTAWRTSTAEVRALPADRSAEGMFWDWPGDTEVVLARKPG